VSVSQVPITGDSLQRSLLNTVPTRNVMSAHRKLPNAPVSQYTAFYKIIRRYEQQDSLQTATELLQDTRREERIARYL